MRLAGWGWLEVSLVWLVSSVMVSPGAVAPVVWVEEEEIFRSIAGSPFTRIWRSQIIEHNKTCIYCLLFATKADSYDLESSYAYLDFASFSVCISRCFNLL